MDRARSAIKSLLALAPEQAEVRQSDGSWTRVGVKAVVVDAIVRIRPGERVPLDGVVTLGQSAIDQSPVTGESLPIDKAPGDEVFAGTINGDGALVVESTKDADHTTLANIIRMVGEAHARRAPSEQWVEKFARVYTPGVVLLAIAIAIGPPLLAAVVVFAVPPLLLAAEWSVWTYNALVLLVIACPCALVIATPVSIVAALKEDGPLSARPLFWHYPHYGNQGGLPGGAVREGDWKLIEFFEDDHVELFKLRLDPGEQDDRAQSEPEVARMLREKLHAWRTEVGAKMPAPNPNYTGQTEIPGQKRGAGARKKR